MHENLSRVSYSQGKGRVKKSKQFVDQVKNCARLKFRKIAAFVSKWVTIYIYFSQNQKGFGCIVAAVLLILSSKELI